MLDKILKLLGLNKLQEIDSDEPVSERPDNQEESDGYYRRDSQMFDERREELEKDEAKRRAIEKFRRGEID